MEMSSPSRFLLRTLATGVGSGLFITTVVLGLVILLAKVKVSRSSMGRDIAFYIVSVQFCLPLSLSLFPARLPMPVVWFNPKSFLSCHQHAGLLRPVPDVY